MRKSQLVPAAAAALSLVTTIGAILALTALNNGGDAGVLRLAAGADRKAEALLADPTPGPAELAAAERLAQLAVREYPYDTSAWLRLAYVDRQRHGRLTPAGAAYLQRSYDLVPVDAYVGVWRVGFALENSQELTKQLRTAAKAEFATLWQAPQRRVELRQLARAIRNPAGRLSAGLWLRPLEAAAAR